MNELRLRLLVVTVCGMTFFLGIELGGFNLVFLRISRNFGLSTSLMGILVASQYIAITAAPAAFGILADRIGKKKTLLIFIPVFSAGCLLAGLSNSVLAFVAGIVILGTGYSVCECVGGSALSDSFPGRENRYMNLTQCTFSLGAVVSPLFFRWFLESFDVNWSRVFILPACGYVLLFPFMLFSECREIPLRKYRSIISFKPVLFSPFFLSLFAAMMAYVAMETGISYFIDSLLVNEYRNSALSAWTISGFWFTMAVSRLFFSAVSMKKRTMILLGFFFSAVILFFVFFMRNQWIFVTSVLCLGFVMGPVWPMVIGTGMSSYQERSGTVAGILSAGGGLGGVLIPLLIGTIADRAGFYAGFLLLGFVSASGFILIKCLGNPVR